MKMKKMKARRKVREPRFCFKTMSDGHVLDDGYKWRNGIEKATSLCIKLCLLTHEWELILKKLQLDILLLRLGKLTPMPPDNNRKESSRKSHLSCNAS
ncbi:hypothetical protein JHK84_034566 [Glycine max]|nr:hypothetical protein JHK85_034941 [Glycine max]KAG4986607.1 hypothetical protein JHK86_034298 [Glycine max]KAG5140798.1 hypothetical protein JHK84_034566 [Glycine max]